MKLQLKHWVVVGASSAKLKAVDRQSSPRTSEGKPEDTFFIKYDLVLLKLLFCVTY